MVLAGVTVIERWVHRGQGCGPQGAALEQRGPKRRNNSAVVRAIGQYHDSSPLFLIKDQLRLIAVGNASMLKNRTVTFPNKPDLASRLQGMEGFCFLHEG